MILILFMVLINPSQKIKYLNRFSFGANAFLRKKLDQTRQNPPVIKSNIDINKYDTR